MKKIKEYIDNYEIDIIRIVRIVFLIILFVVVLALLPFLLIYFCKYIISLLGIKSDYESIILNTYGVVIASTITLFGVILTLSKQRDETKKENIVKFKPILQLTDNKTLTMCIMREAEISFQINLKSGDSESDKKRDLLYKQLRENCPNIDLLFVNKGRGETYNAVLEQIEIKEVSWDKDNHIYPMYGTQYIGQILQGNYFKLFINLPNYLFLKSNEQSYKLSIVIKINYSDMFDKVRYQYELFLKIKVIVEQVLDEPFFYKEGFVYAKVNYELDEVMPQNNIFSEKEKKYMHELYYINKRKSSRISRDSKY